MKRFFLIGVFCLWSLPPAVSACMCYPGDPASAFNHSKLVFIGRMLGGTEKFSRQDPDGKSYVIEAGQVRFAIEQVFKGEQAEEVTIQVDSAEGTSCGPYGLRRGESYIVYAYRDDTKEKKLSTGYCTRTKMVSGENAKDDLKFLRNLPPTGVGGNLRGLIYVDVKGGGDEPLPDVRVKISNGEGQVITAFTDKNGRFQVKQLKPGKYKVEPQFPANYTSEEKFLDVDIDDRGAADVAFVAVIDGRVSGRIVDVAGNSFNHILLDMVGTDKSVSGYSTGDDGEFAVEGAPPGEYVLYVEMQRADKTKRPYYYPGTFEREKAAVIRVGLAEKVDGLEFRLPREFVVRTVEGEVVWNDGTRAADVEVLLLCAQSSRPDGLILESTTRRTTTDAEGRFRLEGFTGESYLITARGRKDGKRLVDMHSPSRRIAAGESVDGLKLVLSAKGYVEKGACPLQ